MKYPNSQKTYVLQKKGHYSRIINCYTAVGQLRGSQGAICASKIPKPIGGLARGGSRILYDYCIVNGEKGVWGRSPQKNLGPRPFFFGKRPFLEDEHPLM